MALNTKFAITAFAMPYSVLNDLAEAMKALDGKKPESCKTNRIQLLHK